uniref:Uncharacterized protein n=1 Tax=Arundo donax TaxID=35708 RepID=A0A0A9ADU2_ARUDO
MVCSHYGCVLFMVHACHLQDVYLPFIPLKLLENVTQFCLL